MTARPQDVNPRDVESLAKVRLSNTTVRVTWQHIMLLVAMLVSACGQVTGSPARPTPTATMAVAATAPASPLAAAFNTPASADVMGLHIQTDGITCGGFVVLHDPQRASYDHAALDAIGQYVTLFAADTTFSPWFVKYPFSNDSVYVHPLPHLPNTLEVLPGGSECDGVLTVTNTGNVPVDVTGLGVHVAQAPVKNPTKYALVDACGVWHYDLISGCGPAGAGGPTCVVGESTSVSPSGTTIQGAPTKVGAGVCPLPVTIGPTETVDLENAILSTQDQTLYEVYLSLIISTPGKGPSTVTLPSSFNSTLVFAGTSEFSCYALSGGHTAQVTPNLDVDSWGPVIPLVNNQACV